MDRNDFPAIRLPIKTYSTDDGNTLAIELSKDSAPVRFAINVGHLGVLISRLVKGAKAAAVLRKENDPTANLVGEMRFAAGEKIRQISVGHSISGAPGYVALMIELSGVPFTALLTPEVSRAVAQDLLLKAD
jgi:hypothetical protein